MPLNRFKLRGFSYAISKVIMISLFHSDFIAVLLKTLLMMLLEANNMHIENPCFNLSRKKYLGILIKVNKVIIFLCVCVFVCGLFKNALDLFFHFFGSKHGCINIFKYMTE